MDTNHITQGTQMMMTTTRNMKDEEDETGRGRGHLYRDRGRMGDATMLGGQEIGIGRGHRRTGMKRDGDPLGHMMLPTGSGRERGIDDVGTGILGKTIGGVGDVFISYVRSFVQFICHCWSHQTHPVVLRVIAELPGRQEIQRIQDAQINDILTSW